MTLKGIVSCSLFALFGVVFTIVSMATPMYEGENVKIYPFKICSPPSEPCTDTSGDVPGYASQLGTIRFVCALLFFNLITSTAGVAFSALEHFKPGRIRQMHLLYTLLIADVFSFLIWTIDVGNYYNSSGMPTSYHDEGLRIGSSPTMMILSWLAFMIGALAIHFLPDTGAGVVTSSSTEEAVYNQFNDSDGRK